MSNKSYLVERSELEWEVKLGMNVNGEFWNKHICKIIREVGKQAWTNGFNDTEREKEYVQMKNVQEIKVWLMEMWGQE